MPLVVYNPVSMPRREPVEATVKMGRRPTAVTVVDDGDRRDRARAGRQRDGRTAPDRLSRRTCPRSGSACSTCSAAAAAAATPTSLQRDADVAREQPATREDGPERRHLRRSTTRTRSTSCCAAPIMLELRDNPSPSWPAWEVLYETVQSPAREYASNPAIEVHRAAGPCAWRSKSRARPRARRSSSTCGWPKAAIASTSRTSSTGGRRTRSSRRRSRSPRPIPKAMYDLGARHDRRARTTSRTSTKCPRRSGRRSTTRAGRSASAMINDSKYGWDKPNDNTLRLTLLHTPRPNTGYTYQSSNDLGAAPLRLCDRGPRRRLATGPDAGARDRAQSAARRVPDDAHAGAAGPRVLDGHDSCRTAARTTDRTGRHRRDEEGGGLATRSSLRCRSATGGR